MAPKDETVTMNVLIAERSYPLKVLKADEEKVGKAAKLVNDRIKEYQDNYAGKDKQDYMAMCLLNFAVENMNAESEKVENSRLLNDKLARLEETLTAPAQ